MCSSASFLFHTSSGPVRYLCYLSQALCAWNDSRHFLISHPKLGWREVCKPKASPPRAEPGWRSPTAQKCFYLRKEQAFHFLFSHLERQSWPRCRPCRVPSAPGSAQQVSLQGSSTQGTRGNLSPEAANPQERTIQRLFVQSLSNPAKGYSEDGSWGCRQGGGLGTRTNLARKGDQLGGLSPPPEKSPRGFLALLSSRGA